MLYMLLPGVAERLTEWVRKGGTLVGTFLTGIADENDLVFEGGWPGPLRPMFGIWAEEIDYLYEDESNRLISGQGNTAGLSGEYKLMHACDLIHAESAQVQATYGDDFYAGRPCLTRNRFGAGTAWYVAAFSEQRLFDDLHARLVRDLGIRRALDADLPEGVTAQVRTDGTTRYVFLMNFTKAEKSVDLGPAAFADAVGGGRVSGVCRLEPYGVRVLKDK